MQKWEYAVVRVSGQPANRANELDDWGELGWELVAVTANGAESMVYMKRPVQ